MVWAHDPVADPRFPSLSLGKNLLFGKIFAKKLQENERNWTEKECGSTSLDICGTPIVPKLIANLVGLILQDKHDITYINTWGCLLMKKNITHILLCPTPAK